jgi:hypothetical protein
MMLPLPLPLPFTPALGETPKILSMKSTNLLKDFHLLHRLN